MTAMERVKLVHELCSGFCKYYDMLESIKEEQGKRMIRSIACDRCPTKKLQEEEREK